LQSVVYIVGWDFLLVIKCSGITRGKQILIENGTTLKRRFAMGDKGKKDKDKRGQQKQSKQDKKSQKK